MCSTSAPRVLLERSLSTDARGDVQKYKYAITQYRSACRLAGRAGNSAHQVANSAPRPVSRGLIRKSILRIVACSATYLLGLFGIEFMVFVSTVWPPFKVFKSRSRLERLSRVYMAGHRY